jgi:hypothetical protein
MTKLWFPRIQRGFYTAAMPARKPPDPDAKPQIERFREAAIELGCDDDEATFDANLKKLLQAGPPAKYEPKKRHPKK